MRRDLRAAVPILALGILVQASCGTPPVPRVDPATLTPDVQIVQSLAIRFGGRQMLGRGVVVKSGPRLDVFVLAPTGTRLLTVRQDGMHVEADARLPGLARLDPDRLLRDIRWAFFTRCPTSSNPTAATSRCRTGDAEVVETRDPASGLVVSRTFTSGRERVNVAIHPDPARPPDAPPLRLRMENPNAGYSMDIVLESVEPAPARGDAP